MAVENRDAFLTKLATKLGREQRVDGVIKPDWSVSPQKEVMKGVTEEELIEIFSKQCKAIHTDFKRTDKEGLRRVLEETVEAYGGKTIITANDPRNKEYDLDGLYHAENVEYDVHIWDYRLGIENERFAERADIGITFSDVTLAETATVTLFHNKDHGRSISLMPKSYIAIIPKNTLVPRMTQAAQQIHEKVANGEVIESCISFISGPSNSADIEMKLIVGVHGPIHATYILVD